MPFLAWHIGCLREASVYNHHNKLTMVRLSDNEAPPKAAIGSGWQTPSRLSVSYYKIHTNLLLIHPLIHLSTRHSRPDKHSTNICWQTCPQHHNNRERVRSVEHNRRAHCCRRQLQKRGGRNARSGWNVWMWTSSTGILKHVDIMPGKVVESSNKNKFFFVILSIGLETGVYVRTQEA